MLVLRVLTNPPKTLMVGRCEYRIVFSDFLPGEVKVCTRGELEGRFAHDVYGRTWDLTYKSNSNLWVSVCASLLTGDGPGWRIPRGAFAQNASSRVNENVPSSRRDCGRQSGRHRPSPSLARRPFLRLGPCPGPRRFPGQARLRPCARSCWTGAPSWHTTCNMTQAVLSRHAAMPCWPPLDREAL